MDQSNTEAILAEPWWASCVAGLAVEPLAAWAVRVGVDEAALRAALASVGAGGPAEAAPWWPEAMRMRANSSLRAIARAFGTEPRRLRRALARLNLRAGGVEVVAGEGVPALAPFADVLGREPDAAVARRAGVIPEAVQGERRRLGLPAYFQRRRVRFSREEEAWIRGPQRGRRARVQVDDALQVVRRPVRSDERAHRPSGWGVGHADPRPREAAEMERRAPWPERWPTRSEAAEELERLLQPVRQRDGRQRIVRSEPARAPEVVVRSAPAARVEASGRPRLARGLPRMEGELAAEPALRPAPTSVPPASVPAPAVEASTPAPVARAAAVVRRRAAAPPASSPAAPAAAEVEWLVAVPGSNTPLRVHASDLLGAIAAAGRIIPADILRRASVWRADETS